MNRSRRWAMISLAVATLLIALAVGGAWWGAELYAYSAIAGNTGSQLYHVDVSYELSGTIACSSWNWPSNVTPCSNISSSVGGWRAAFLIGVDVAVLVLAGLAALATALAVLTNLGRLRQRFFLRLEILLVIVIALSSGLLLVGSIAIGPGPQAGSTCWYLSGNLTSCPFYWGSSQAGSINGGCTLCDISLLWGAGTAFYEVFLAAAITAITGFFLWISREGPFTADEERLWADRHRPIGTPAPGPKPSVFATPTRAALAPTTAPEPTFEPDPAQRRAKALRYQIAKADWSCPNCGATNSRYAGQCGTCHADRPATD